MAIKTNTISAVPVSGTTGPGFLQRLRTGYAGWAERARIRWELAQMTPRELADLGLHPSDIEDVARGTYRRA